MELQSRRSQYAALISPTFFVGWGVLGLFSFAFMVLTEIEIGGPALPGRVLEALLLGVPALALVYAGCWLRTSTLDDEEVAAIGWYAICGVLIAALLGIALFLSVPFSGVDTLFVFFYFLSTGTEGALIGMLLGTFRVTNLFFGHRQDLAAENDRLEEFASVVAHDLRNPLNVAQARVSLAREEHDSEHLEKAERAHQRMDDLIQDCLILARHGRSAVELEAVHLSATADRAWDNVQTETATFLNDADCVVRADEGMLDRVFENLLSNAVEHGAGEHSGGAGVTVRVGTLADGFYVEDDGPGIPPGDRDAVFEAGYSTGEGGTGFGLRIVEIVAETHGWTVEVTEGTDGGARFEIRGVEFADGY